ncbi:MAG: DUF4065 domain-containing protein [Comamonas sp.]|uniref:Panacea domain-containing protein n=1 Tax=Comamonas sp. TaxID=34028 RepID=UPI002FCB8D1E
MTNPINVAAWFINHVDRDSGDSMTPLKLQKLLYYAQAWHLLAFDEPLFQEEMQAWAHGPVVPSVYHEFKTYGFNSIPEYNGAEEIDEESERILSQVADIYGEFSAKRLEAMTHMEDPWKDARRGIAPEARCDAVIPKDTIKAYFQRTYGEMTDEQNAA